MADTVTLFIGNLAYDVSEADIRAAFARFADALSVRLVTDRGGRPKGFAFVELPRGAADAAMEGLRGTQLRGRTMDIAPATPQSRGDHGGRGRRRRF